MLPYRQMEHGFDPPLPLVVRYTLPCQRGEALDLGCGQGYNSFYVAEQGYHVDAVDGCQPGTMLHDAEEIQSKLGLHALVKRLPIALYYEKIEDFLPTKPAGHYDLVIATHVLHFDTWRGHLLYPVVMPEIIRVLKPGGRLICALLKSKQDKQWHFREMIPEPLPTRMTDDELASFWQPFLQPVHFDPARIDDLKADGTSGPFQYCTYELVADKP